MCPGSILAWSTLPSVGITKTWCYTQSTITIGESQNSGTESLKIIENDLKKPLNKRTSYYSKRILTFCSISTPWSTQVIYTSKRLRFIRHCRCLGSISWPSQGPTMRVSQQASILVRRWTSCRDPGLTSVSSVRRSIGKLVRKSPSSPSTG
jgi:hypothetical protein